MGSFNRLYLPNAAKSGFRAMAAAGATDSGSRIWLWLSL
jgi:hypothetical protein